MIFFSVVFQLALKLPQGTEVEKTARAAALDAGLKTAVSVPFGLAQKANSVWDILMELAQVGNINCKSDLQVRNQHIHAPDIIPGYLTYLAQQDVHWAPNMYGTCYKYISNKMKKTCCAKQWKFLVNTSKNLATADIPFNALFMLA